MHNQILHLKRAFRTVFSKRKHQLTGTASFIIFLTLYLFTLPATYTGGRVGMVSLQYLTPTLAGFAIIMSGLIALLIPFNIYALNLGAETATATTTTGFLGSIMPPLLCCSPLIPALFAGIAAFIPALGGTSGTIQGFIAVYETEILTAATILLTYAVFRSAQTLHKCRI
ncbi:MAG: hypothetical protein SVV03_05435 [Candidatus Nanohaloarchaea archaeon]|nr:hypothetical protein [Candidatus Nanohaloarchaea archaeon]